MAAAMMAVVEETPRLAKNLRRFSKARFMRILTALSTAPNTAPISL
jgi:hypothetical protein